MKTMGLMAMAWLTGSSLFAGQSKGAKEEGLVTVCIEAGPSIPLGTLTLVSKMFARIAVRIDWHTRACPAGAGTIQVDLSSHAPDSQFRHSLAFAQPYEGSHIVIFADRVQKRQESICARCPDVMAHVLVHEITHMLEGISRHSAAGIMKAQWDERDYFAMGVKPLGFDPEDIYLIHRGLEARQSGLAATPPTITATNWRVAVQ